VLAGKAVVFGPHMENFAAIVARWREVDAAVQVADAAELQAQLAELLADPNRCRDLAQRARKIVAAHEGATARTAETLLAGKP
jgi:3-deoxy-D-manno-octulosonic-acid transferase